MVQAIRFHLFVEGVDVSYVVVLVVPRVQSSSIASRNACACVGFGQDLMEASRQEMDTSIFAFMNAEGKKGCSS